MLIFSSETKGVSTMKKILIILLLLLLIAGTVILLWVSRMNIDLKPGSEPEKQTEEQQKEEEEKKDAEEDLLKAVVPPEDFELAGEYQDETSQRATMTITPDGEDHYQVEISWGDSDTQTTVWAFEGDFDREGGLLSYKDCIKSILTVTEDDGMKEEIVYESGKGALLYFDEGLHWQDDKEDAGKGCVFVKTGDEDVVIEDE